MTQPVTPPVDPPTDPPAPPADPPKDPPKPDDPPLGEGGMKALAAEREARKALEKQLAALSPLQKLADALVGDKKPDGKTEVDLITERLAKHETDLATEREARWKAEVAHASGLTPEQAEWLRGTTREEIQGSADRLKAAFPAAPAGSRPPVPDPSQGARGNSAEVDLDAQIREAQSKRDWRTVISLQNQKLANHTN